MSEIRGKIEASVSLSSSTCYFMRTGKCSLNIISNFFIAPSTHTAANDLLYCPRLFRAMYQHKKMKPIGITPCDCGHAEVISGHQRACIAGQKHFELMVKPVGKKPKENCPVCGNQVLSDQEGHCNRIVNLNICIIDEKR